MRPGHRRRDVDLRLVPLGFLGLLALGTVLLRLPWTHAPGAKLGWLDALFLSTSAVCVTGLSTVNVAETLNGFGQVVLLLLIQAGGLGIFTASITLALLGRNRLSLSDEQAINATVGRLREARPRDVFIYACLFVLVIELAGVAALVPMLVEVSPGSSPGRILWEAVFHSVSAFCNAGLSIYPDGVGHWRQHHAILAVLEVLTIAGGIGLMTLINLRFLQPWRRDMRRRGRLTLQSRLSLWVAAMLLGVGALATLMLEWGHTLKEATFTEAVSWSFFHSAMARTAGFNVVDMGQTSPLTLLVTIGLMFIGGAPGSMAGGVKTVTFAVLLATAWSALTRRDEVQLLGRRVRPQMSHVAVMITLMAAGCVGLGIGMLMLTEAGRPAAMTEHQWLAVAFEAVSAFGTTGLSTGITPLLSEWGKGVIVLLMFTGRVGPLVLSVYLARPVNPRLVRHPYEEVALG